MVLHELQEVSPEPPHREARGTADTQMPGMAHADVPAAANTTLAHEDATNPPQVGTQPEDVVRPEDPMSVEEEQQLQSSCDNTQQLEEEEQQSAGHKKPLSDKDRETMAYNHCTALIKAITAGKSKWLKYKDKAVETLHDY